MTGTVDITELRNRHPVEELPPPARLLGHMRDVQALPHVPAPFEETRIEPQVLSCANDDTLRWSEGERLQHLFEACCARFGNSLAIVGGGISLTYRDLDRRANQLARYLIDRGVTSGDRVGLLFDKSVETYVALLATLKVNAAYVPFDPGFPTERIGFILADAQVKTIVSMSSFEEALRSFDVRHIYVDAAKPDIDAKSPARLSDHEVRPPVDQTCYIIYTSGTTGNPKGVMIEHPSICNFVRVAAECYGFGPGDRVYQGMSIAFDFSVEELWVPLMAGATLVPGRPGASLLGDELADFLRDHKVTCLCCCPTLLATIEQELPQLRVLLVGGEACPQNLVLRWHRPGRRILNSYGPTEATVTATLAELTPEKPVTIGKPLPTYTIVILDPREDRAVASGELGEIGIAGIGLAAGYLNRDELTQKKFVPDFLGIRGNPSKRIYRTGDLGRINDDGEVEYHGRIDTQVKIRGYRIELVEIESVLLELPEIAQAAVATYEPEPRMVELVAYYSLKKGASDISPADIARALRSKLPAYMVPGFLEELPFIPMLISNKADHKKLPKPKGPRVRVGNGLVLAKNEQEESLARALAEVLKVEHVSVEDHFFKDLGANSLLMARFCAKIRQNPDFCGVSMRDIYVNPTIAKLADHLGRNAPNDDIAAQGEPFHVPSNLSYFGCGALQLLSYAGYGLLYLWVLSAGFMWTYAAIDNPAELYLRSVAFNVAIFVGMSAVSIAAKWLLIGKWKAETFPIWSLRYFRFWAVKSLAQSAPMAAFAGSPIYNVYLRLLGAKIGKNTVIYSRFVPVCSDLFSVGDDTILRKDSILLGYKAQSNFIHTGAIEIGAHAFVGEASVLDIDTAMGNRTQLGHASSLQSGQRVPDGKHYHGSPAIETKADYCPIDAKRCSALRRSVYASLQLFLLFAIAAPLPIMILNYWYPYFLHIAGNAHTYLDESTPQFVSLMLTASTAVFLGALVLGLIGVYGIPRLAQRFLDTERTYPLYGLHYWLQRVILLASNSQFYNLLFGDSSIIVHYMRFVGWRLNEVEQTGSNFGTNQRHDNPFLCEIGSHTMVSDGLSMINVHMSSSSFRLAETTIGASNYLGNDIHYPPDGRTGANCLLATKVMIPIDGPVLNDVGLLGSPAFEIPRMVERDRTLSTSLSGEARRERIQKKNVHNFVTACLFLSTRWLFLFAILAIAHLGTLNYRHFGIFSLFAAGALITIAMILYFAFVERASLKFKRLTPKMVTIYEPYFWRHERHWKLSDTPIMELFAGTPFKTMILRLLGVKIGRKVYDGGCAITDRSLTEIGDYANLNQASVLQAHSLEEGVFKSDYIEIGKGSTLGAGAFVHYGVKMGEHVVLDADSFLMKGEILDAHTAWRGNPARMSHANAARSNVIGRCGMSTMSSRQSYSESTYSSVPAE